MENFVSQAWQFLCPATLNYDLSRGRICPDMYLLSNRSPYGNIYKTYHKYFTINI